MPWVDIAFRMPDPDKHDRVLVYMEGHDFNGEQVFDVKTETLNESFYADPADQPEVCKLATQWAPRPFAVSIVGDLSEHLCHASQQAFVAIRNIALSEWRRADENDRWKQVFAEILAIADTAHNLPEVAMSPESFDPAFLSSFIENYSPDSENARIPVSMGSPDGFRFWCEVKKLAEGGSK